MGQDGKDALTRGEAALDAGHFDHALELATALLAAGAAPPGARRLHAKALEGLGNRPAAIASLQDGIAQAPDSPSLRVTLGKLLAEEGQHPDALTQFEAAVAADALQLEGWKGILSYRAVPPDTPALADVAASVADTSRSTRLRAKAGFVMGQILTEAGQHSAGFGFYAAANAIMAAAESPGALEYRYPVGTFLDRAALDRHARPAPPGQCPAILIAGLPRSGKSLTEALVAANPAVRAGDELAVLARFARTLDWTQGPEAVLASLGAQTPSPLTGLYAAQTNGAARVTDTAPTNLFRLGLLALAHPDVPVVLCRRNPLDLGVSMFFKQFRRGNMFTTALPTLGRAIARAERLMDHWQATLPNPLLVLDYAETVIDPEGTVARLSALTGLDLPRPQRGGPDATRLTPGRSLGHQRVSADLVGVAAPFVSQLRPLMEAYQSERARTK